jgi:hypothetical protein
LKIEMSTICFYGIFTPHLKPNRAGKPPQIRRFNRGAGSGSGT